MFKKVLVFIVVFSLISSLFVFTAFADVEHPDVQDSDWLYGVRADINCGEIAGFRIYRGYCYDLSSGQIYYDKPNSYFIDDDRNYFLGVACQQYYDPPVTSRVSSYYALYFDNAGRSSNIKLYLSYDGQTSANSDRPMYRFNDDSWLSDGVSYVKNSRIGDMWCIDLQNVTSNVIYLRLVRDFFDLYYGFATNFYIVEYYSDVVPDGTAQAVADAIAGIGDDIDQPDGMDSANENIAGVTDAMNEMDEQYSIDTGEIDTAFVAVDDLYANYDFVTSLDYVSGWVDRFVNENPVWYTFLSVSLCLGLALFAIGRGFSGA